MTAEWSGLTGTSSALAPGSTPGTFVSGITYDAVGNATFNFYVDDSGNGRTNFDYGATVAETDDVDATFNDGALVLSVLIVGRSEEHTSELQSLMRISSAFFCLKKKQHSTT